MAAERAPIIEMIDEAVAAGAGLMSACEEAAIDRRTYRRWSDPDTGSVRTDTRPAAVRPAPSNRIDDAVRAAMLELCRGERFADAPPSRSFLRWPTRVSITRASRRTTACCTRPTSSTSEDEHADARRRL